MKRLLRPLSVVALGLALAAVSLWSLSEARRTAGRDQRLTAALAARDAEVAALQAELADARVAAAADRSAHARSATAAAERIRQLELELARALDQVGTVNAGLDARRAELEALQRRVDERWRTARAPMPESARLAVRALSELLRADGYHGLRVLRAAALADGALHEVELVERSDDGLDFAYYRVGALRAALDRSTAALDLRLRGGHVLRGGEVEDLPADGEVVVALARVDGRAWEARVPYLLTAVGDYPDEREAAPARPRVDPITAAAWADRLDQVLAVAETTPRWTVRRLRDLRDGEFVELALTGTGAGGLLEGTISARRAAVEVDRGQGTVWLALHDGTLRRRGGATTIPAAGYRILLAGVTPERADAVLLGMLRPVGGG